MAMNCPVCQNEGPEGKKHCSECGAELPQAEQTPEEQPIIVVSTKPKPRWLSTHRKGLFVAAVVLVVVLASVGFIYALPWSKVNVLIDNHDHFMTVRAAIYIDGSHVATIDVAPNEKVTAGVYAIYAGSHMIQVDWDYLDYPHALDSMADWAETVEVGLFQTEDLWVIFEPPY